jgi:hypothetical protein
MAEDTKNDSAGPARPNGKEVISLNSQQPYAPPKTATPAQPPSSFGVEKPIRKP